MHSLPLFGWRTLIHYSARAGRSRHRLQVGKPPDRTGLVHPLGEVSGVTNGRHPGPSRPQGSIYDILSVREMQRERPTSREHRVSLLTSTILKRWNYPELYTIGAQVDSNYQSAAGAKVFNWQKSLSLSLALTLHSGPAVYGRRNILIGRGRVAYLPLLIGRLGGRCGRTAAIY